MIVKLRQSTHTIWFALICHACCMLPHDEGLAGPERAQILSQPEARHLTPRSCAAGGKMRAGFRKSYCIFVFILALSHHIAVFHRFLMVFTFYFRICLQIFAHFYKKKSTSFGGHYWSLLSLVFGEGDRNRFGADGWEDLEEEFGCVVFEEGCGHLAKLARHGHGTATSNFFGRIGDPKKSMGRCSAYLRISFRCVCTSLVGFCISIISIPLTRQRTPGTPKM